MSDATSTAALQQLEAEGIVAADVQLAELLERVSGFLTRFVVFRAKAQVTAISLWVIHSWAFSAAETTAYLAVTSPEKRSGKTRLQEVLELLVARPLRVSNISVAALFREIDSDSPTVFFDEADAFFSRKGDAAEELRGILNAGHRRGATVARCVGEGKGLKTQRFNVFCPKLVAAIGNLPDTIADRSIHCRLERRREGERVERFRYRDAKADADPLRKDLEAWAGEHLEELKAARPNLPEALDDRAADGWEPLLALADAAGGEWPRRARAAAVELAGAHFSDDESLGVLLLEHVRDAFGHEPKITTDDLLHALINRDTGPWPAWWSRDVEDGRLRGPASRLARLLKPFGVGSKKLRIDESTTARGFTIEDFAEPFARYLVPSSKSEQRNSAGQGLFSGPNESRKPEGNIPSEQACSLVPSSGSEQGHPEDGTAAAVELLKRELRAEVVPNPMYARIAREQGAAS